ncbi:MAG: peptidoglycan-binding protein [Alphaproteobacteria bacterium]
MGFTKTSEGRVFFQNAGNDDVKRTAAAAKRKAISAANGSPKADPVMPADNTQMQILMLLKSLNTKLKGSKEENTNLKKQLAQYKASIKSIEEQTKKQQEDYIDLEQKVARKQNESSKKTARVEQNVKSQVENTLKQLEEAKDLVKQLEEKGDNYDESLLTLKKQVDEQKKRDVIITKRQKTIETAQKKHNEKMVSSVATYVDLTKRVSETETRQEALDNKIEDSRSEYLKLDRKIDKAIEDRNRILRKVERIEQAVIETRDALNAKAMVLLTDQGAVAGIDMPQISDQTMQADPVDLNRRLQEEALMPWWRKPVRIQSTSLALMMVVVLLLGWIMSSAQQPSPHNYAQTQTQASPARVSIDIPESAIPTTAPQATQNKTTNYITPTTQSTEQNEYAAKQNGLGTAPENQTEEDYGITIHKGSALPPHAEENVQARPINIQNEQEMIDAFENAPNDLAKRLNDIEPSSLTAGDKASPTPQETVTRTAPLIETHVAKPAIVQNNNNQAYINALKGRIAPDNSLTDIAKKIETQAFNGVPEAQHDLGAIYVAGHGQIKQNLGRAVFWFTEAANNNIANAKYNLGVLYHQGLGVEQSISRAISLYSEAADLDHPEAQYNLGIAYIEGIGVPYTPSRAARYFEQAANHGVVEAAYNLGLIYENGLLGETQPDLALSWYKSAADQGSPEAQSALDQLATSLGIDIEDVNRIVENMQRNHAIYSNQPSSQAGNNTIARIQEELMRRGLYPGPVDGMTGPMTRNAIENFQSAAGLSITGEASEELLGYLKASASTIYR